ncbi:DUF1853 family protein [uncultured Polaribacter sp.]|uniref:DUF1853 family protein n=1 Tax=uncultured Polaribacter sp. TaxID=174711 RepID=UPI0026354B92|nr:DUF1853 family protein [uncultured Polaribacter sp.]
MHQKTKEIQKRYDGFLQTPCLWKNTAVFDIDHFNIEPKSLKIDIDLNEKLRLGKYIERFVSFQLQNEKSIKIVAENIQIQQEKRTLGELDCLLLENNKPIHLEIIYKFYLYDKRAGNREIEHFIGPNRKDALIEKLTKLKEKQLPLFYSNECKAYLETLNLSSEKITQKVYFKAQLFVPFSNKGLQLKQLNTNCIVGFYINRKELIQFKECKFYIPTKKDWLIQPHSAINWISSTEFNKKSKDYLERQFSPLCWLKKPNGILEKFFLVWWG